MGYDCPKVGVLACVEKLNPKMPETIEADALKQMNLRGEITGCVVEGPISYDCAISKEIAEIKEFHSPCAGDCDVLLAPNIHAGNIMLADSNSKIAVNMIRQAKETRCIANGDLTTTVTVNSPEDVLGEALCELVLKFHGRSGDPGQYHGLGLADRGD